MVICKQQLSICTSYTCMSKNLNECYRVVQIYMITSYVWLCTIEWKHTREVPKKLNLIISTHKFRCKRILPMRNWLVNLSWKTSIVQPADIYSIYRALQLYRELPGRFYRTVSQEQYDVYSSRGSPSTTSNSGCTREQQTGKRERQRQECGSWTGTRAWGGPWRWWVLGAF